MDYSTLATSIGNKKTELSTTVQNIENIQFDSIWTGGSSEKLTGDLKTILENIKSQEENITTFIAALQYLQTYKTNKERLQGLQVILNSTSNMVDDNSKSQLQSEISNLSSLNNSYRQSIKGLLSSITPISSTASLVNYTISGTDYILDINEFYELFENNELTKIPDSGKSSLYDYYSKEEVEAVLANIKENYSGREATVNSALAIMKLASDAGVKLDYDWGGGHSTVTSTDSVATGVDCSAFASWAINQGSTETFSTRTTSGLINTGTKIDYSDAQVGDILVYRSGDSGHVVLVVENNPETETFLVAEANGSSEGVILKERSYSSLQSGAYQARDLTSIYNE